ncbi:unnamed protein product [Orchesella dallaii]|uniref:Synphilin-1 n=1 Tax=Orchesella dallaii TaxID=48710 RepID=A0ABP1QZ47_9HEXA
MDKGDGSKKRSPAGTTRRAYSLFGGIINLAHTPTTKSIATSSNVSAGTTEDPQGPSNVYTVIVNNDHTRDCTTNQKKSDQSPSTVSSLNSRMSGNASSSKNGAGRIGPAPRTVSILTALNELAISDEIGPPPPVPSSLPPPVSTSGCRNASASASTSKSNPSHSTYHHLSKRSGHSGSSAQENIDVSQYEIPTSTGGSSSASVHHSHSHIYHSTSKGGIYSNPTSSASSSRFKGYNEQQRSAVRASTNTLPSALRIAHKSPSNRKETLTLKAATKQRDRSKSRTPDWIWKIFQLTKHGKLEELQQSLLGLDSTLIRHLADAKGNTVLHCAVRGGHVNTLQWLVSVLGPQCTEAALNDHNQAGRTVILTALKKGQLQCLQWLVQHTKYGEKALVPNDGERSLLHYAATYGDINVVRWLCTELIEKGIHVDIRDSGGMTPLHDAAKSGHIIVCHELILAGADPLSQTELGWRPSDLAIRHRHMECASYFMVAEAAGSLGNQLHSLLLAFNHLRQEHEELRSQFRETLRVGKWLAKERNDLIKHFPSKWAQEATSSMLLGGTNNGTRFSDLEHKLVIAEQTWKKFSQNLDDAGEPMLNGEEALISNITSRDFLQRRLAAVQLRHERNQSLGSSLSASSDEDQYEENSSSDGSSSDVAVERVSTVTVGSGVGVNSSSAVIIHSSAGSPQMKKDTITTRSKAAPWLLPSNDVFLSQLSPFVGAHGKSLPTLDLLNGAPTSGSLLSPIVTQSSGAAAATTAAATVSPATTTETAGKNEKSLVQMDATERQPGKRDSTSLEISVLEVIEPNSPASSSSSKKKRDGGVEKFHVSPRPWLNFSDQTKGMWRSLPKCATSSPSFGIGGDERNTPGGHHSHLVGKTSEFSAVSPDPGTGSDTRSSSRLASHGQGEHERQLLPTSVGRPVKHHGAEYDLDGMLFSNTSPFSPSQKHATENVHHAPDLIRGTQYRNQPETQPSSLKSRHGKEYPFKMKFSSDSESAIYERIPDAMCVKKPTSSSCEDYSNFDTSHQSLEETMDESNSRNDNSESNHEANEQSGQSVQGHSSSSRSFSIQPNEHHLYSSSEHKLETGSSLAENNKQRGGIDITPVSSTSSNFTSSALKPRTPSPKSYVTKLTVIPVEATTETCFLSLRSTSFVHEDQQQQQQGSHQLHLPGESHDELSSGLSCQLPNDSVSSSNTPVMPRFNSSGTVVFPLRKPDWYSTELLSLTTPDSSLGGRLSPTPSETSRTESALAPPPSYVSHASQNSEASKTESARGQPNEPGIERDSQSPGVEQKSYNAEMSQCECIHSPIVASESNVESVTPDMVGSTESYEMCASSSNSGKDNAAYLRRKKDDDGDNDGTTMKQFGVAGNQRIQATTTTCFIRSHLSTGIHKGSAQRLPKGIRGHSKPWYEIDGSDDEGSLLRVAETRSTHGSRFSSSNSSSSSNPAPESSENESETNGNSDEEDKSETQQQQNQQPSTHNYQQFL